MTFLCVFTRTRRVKIACDLSCPVERLLNVEKTQITHVFKISCCVLQGARLLPGDDDDTLVYRMHLSYENLHFIGYHNNLSSSSKDKYVNKAIFIHSHETWLKLRCKKKEQDVATRHRGLLMVWSMIRCYRTDLKSIWQERKKLIPGGL